MIKAWNCALNTTILKRCSILRQQILRYLRIPQRNLCCLFLPPDLKQKACIYLCRRQRELRLYIGMSRTKNVYEINRFLILKITGCATPTERMLVLFSLFCTFEQKSQPLRYLESEPEGEQGQITVADGWMCNTPTRFLSLARKNVSRFYNFRAGVNIDLDLNWAFKSRLPV